MCIPNEQACAATSHAACTSVCTCYNTQSRGSFAAAVEHGILAVLPDNSELFQLLVANPLLLQLAHQVAILQLSTAYCSTAAWPNRLIALMENGGSSSVAALRCMVSSLVAVYNLAQ